jgi:cell division protein FtsB
VNPHSDVNVVDDMKYLLDQVEKLQKKNDVLSQHNMELTQEMENVRSDFGNDR